MTIYMRIINKIQKLVTNKGHILTIAICSVCFASWLMFHTFSYDAKTHDIQIAYKLWSDFGAHIPLIRSFSMGDNLSRFFHLTVQYPIFPGEPIRYHFLFYMFVGILERIGLRIDWALNIPSILGFASLMVFLYYISWKLTQSKATAILTVIFFLFNGSMGFERFFSLHPFSLNTLKDIIQAKDFPAFAPWGPGEVTAFWNLNIYTNQRHLSFAFSIILLFLITLYKLKELHWRKQVPWAIFWGFLIGTLPFFHQPALLIIAVFMSIYFLVFPSLRVFLFFTGMISLELIVPQLLAVRGTSSPVEWYPGYTIHNELFAQKELLTKIVHMISFWWQNIGLHLLLIPVGFILLSKKAKLFLLPLIPLFIIPNFFKFSIEASANHKFFNFVLLLGGMCSAYTIVRIVKLALQKKEVYLQGMGLYIAVVLTCFLTLSGVIDFFVIHNDIKGKLPDIAHNETAYWIQQNTPPSAIFLNSSYLFHPASIAGRSIFLGWPYFAWSAGYKENRMPIMDTLFETRDVIKRCALLKKYDISYITVENIKNDTNLPDIDMEYFRSKHEAVFVSMNENLAIFTVEALCSPRRSIN